MSDSVVLKAKPRHTLQVKVSLNKLIEFICKEVREKLAMDIELVRKDVNTILYVMEVLDEALTNKDVVEPKVAKKIDKNEILTFVIKRLFENITDEEISIIGDMVHFITDNKLIKSKTWVQSAGRFLSKSANFFLKNSL